MKKLLIIFGALAVVACSHVSTPPPTEAGALDATWTAPTTNTDGSSLTDLASYKLYFQVTGTAPCPGTQSVTVSAAAPNPAPNTTVQGHIPNLKTGTNYTVSVTAVNVDGIESACSVTAAANAHPTTPSVPTGTSGH